MRFASRTFRRKMSKKARTRRLKQKRQRTRRSKMRGGKIKIPDPYDLYPNASVAENPYYKYAPGSAMKEPVSEQ